MIDGSKTKEKFNNQAQILNETQRLYAAQVAQLYKHLPIGIIATFINSLILVFILREFIEHSVLFIWFFAISIISILRYLKLLRFRYSSKVRAEIYPWDTWFIIGMAFSGIIWGSASIFLFPVDSIAHQMFLVFVLGGMVAGAAGIYSVIIKSFLAYSLPILIPVIVRFFVIGDDIHLAMGGMTLLFGILMFSTAKRINKVTVSSLRLQFENSDLINHLASEKDRIEELNRNYLAEIKERKQTDEKLKLAMEQAEAASRAKSEFLASMSHEIRTPMNTVIGMADLLRETSLTAEQKKFISAIQSSGENLLLLINDILDLSKIEAGQIEIEKISFDLMEVVSSTCEAQVFKAQEKGLELSWRISPDIKMYLMGDPTRLGQILTNLIGNALKFTEKGKVAVEVKPHEVSGQSEKRDSHVELLFSVTDTGIGISPEKKEAIFDRFSQADSSTTREYGGTGLGLAISHRLVKLVGGRIWVESDIGQGSTFYFTAKFEVQSDKKNIETSKESVVNRSQQQTINVQEDLEQIRILLVEDNEDNQVLIQAFLKKTQYILDTAENDKIAVDKFTTDKYDLVLMDIEMPVMDGYTATNEIRKWERENRRKETPIIVLTAHALVEHTQKGHRAGCNALLIKPIKKADLLAVIEKHISKIGD